MGYDPGSVEQRLLANDPEALGQVIRWIAAGLASPRFWSLRSEWGDLHQEVLARVVESLNRGRFDASRDFRLYVQGVARYTALQALSGARRGMEMDPTMGNPSEPTGPERHLIERDLVRRALDCSTDECRALIHDYFLLGKDYAELAAEHGVPVGTVKSRLFRCLERLHSELRGGDA